MDDVVPLAAGSAALHLVLRSLGDGALALHRLAPGEPAAILWPEHFDVGISAGRVNYGVSPGDTGHDLPYAYVGPLVGRGGRLLERAVRRLPGHRGTRRRGRRLGVLPHRPQPRHPGGERAVRTVSDS